jgi:hypothetical protein
MTESSPIKYEDDPSTPLPSTIKAYRDAARDRWHRDGEIEIDDNAEISRGCYEGAYVQAWVWVDDSDLSSKPGPSYDTWIAEPDEWEWRFDQRFTSEDPDGKGARRMAHAYTRGLRKTYPCAYVAVRPAGKPPLPVNPTA